MRFDDKPVLRKQIIPWYDADAVCFISIIAMILVLGFAVTGICVASESPYYRPHIWVPILLGIMSGSVLISLVARLFQRR